jgi:phage-related protein (TIGR01555 family)
MTKQTQSKFDAYLDYSYLGNSRGGVNASNQYNPQQYIDAYRNFAILRNYIDIRPSEAVRIFPYLYEEDLAGDDHPDTLKIKEYLQTIEYIINPLDSLNFESFWRQALITADLEGNAFVIIGMEGQEDTEKPLAPGKLKYLALKHIDQISPNPTTGTYTLYLNATTPGVAEIKSSSRVFHKSRIIRLSGTKVPGYNRSGNQYDDSLLAPLLDEYLKLENTFCNVSEMVAQHSFFQLAISGLTQKIATKGASGFALRLEKLMENIKNMGALLIDREKEEANVITRNYGGLDKIVEQNIDWFVAQTGLPKAIVMNMHSQNSLSDGTSSDLKILNSIVARYQNDKYQPALELILGLITEELRLPPVEVKFAPTHPLDELSEAQIDKLKAETEEIRKRTETVTAAPPTNSVKPIESTPSKE